MSVLINLKVFSSFIKEMKLALCRPRPCSALILPFLLVIHSNIVGSKTLYTLGKSFSLHMTLTWAFPSPTCPYINTIALSPTNLINSCFKLSISFDYTDRSYDSTFSSIVLQTELTSSLMDQIFSYWDLSSLSIHSSYITWSSIRWRRANVMSSRLELELISIKV